MKQTNKNKVQSLSVCNLVKNYGEIIALNNISFDTCKGDVISILGPNGAGKSTLMNIIAGFLSPSSGAVFVNNNCVETCDFITKKDIGFLPEGAPMYADMTVKMFLKYFIELKLGIDLEESLTPKEKTGIYKKEYNRITKLAKIENVENQRIETLSKGYSRRVGFAASIIGDPSVLLLDEPTDGLDPNQKKHMRNLITEMSKEKTILISSHLLDEAEAISNKIIVIDKGNIVASGSLNDILKQTKQKNLADAFVILTHGENSYE